MKRWTSLDLAKLPAGMVAPMGAATPYTDGGSTQSAALKPRGEARKYHNDPIVADGVRFDSRLEARCWQWLELRRAAGEILWVTRQVPFRLEGGIVYRVDFLAALAGPPYIELIDATGKLTQTKINKLKQLNARYGITVTIWPPR
jgi:hypothetical protein